MKRQIRKTDFDLNSLPLLPEMIKEICTFIPNQWILYKKGKYKLKKGDAVRMEKIEYGNLKSKSIYSVPPTIDCVGKILYICGYDENFCKVQFLKRRGGYSYYDDGKYFLDKKHIRPANFSDKIKVTLTKKNKITQY